MRVALLAVRDPHKLSIAVGGLYAGWLAVIGTLRLNVAKTVKPPSVQIYLRDVNEPAFDQGAAVRYVDENLNEFTYVLWRGAYTYHKTDVWLFAPVAAMLFLALLLHDNCTASPPKTASPENGVCSHAIAPSLGISPPPNWGKVLSPDLSAPLVPPAKA